MPPATKDEQYFKTKSYQLFSAPCSERPAGTDAPLAPNHSRSNGTAGYAAAPL